MHDDNSCQPKLDLQAVRGLSALQQYMIVTANYWAFPLTDGALRMLVVFHFHKLGYSTLEIAFLFLFYEIFGIVTNLYGGWLGPASASSSASGAARCCRLPPC